MRNVLLPWNLAVLAHYAWSNVLVAFDFDGTLAPISGQREEVAMRPQTADLLNQLRLLFPCAVVSGRSCADVVRHLRGVDVPHIIGNHGLEPSPDQERLRAWTARAAPILMARLADLEGVDVEDKGYSISVHYRRARSRLHALRAIARAARSLEAPRLLGGKSVVNLLPPNAPHKGTALVALARQLRVDHVIYAGDDTTDEDVFRNTGEGHLLGIRVGHRGSSAARYYVHDQEHIDDLLRVLVNSRRARAAHGT